MQGMALSSFKHSHDIDTTSCKKIILQWVDRQCGSLSPIQVNIVPTTRQLEPGSASQVNIPLVMIPKISFVDLRAAYIRASLAPEKRLQMIKQVSSCTFWTIRTNLGTFRVHQLDERSTKRCQTWTIESAHSLSCHDSPMAARFLHTIQQ